MWEPKYQPLRKCWDHNLTVFYADDGLVVARDPGKLQIAFDVLTGLFDRVGLKTNTDKTEAVVFLPGKLRTSLTAKSYESRMDQEYREMKSGRRVTCTICNVSLAVGSLRSHLVSQHDVHQSFNIKGSEAAPLKPPWRYVADFFPADGKFRCPVRECPQGDEGYGCTTSFNLRWHFTFRHPRDVVEVQGECLPRCRQCGMQVERSVWGTTKHEASKTCREMADRRRRHRVAAEGGARDAAHFHGLRRGAAPRGQI